MTRNLRIPDAPKLPAEGAGDGVFLRLMALPKGRGMLTRALRLLYAPPSLSESVPGQHLQHPLHAAFKTPLAFLNSEELLNSKQ